MGQDLEYIKEGRQSSNPLEFERTNLNYSSNQNDNWKGMVVGSAIEAGSNIISSVIGSICNAVNKSKDIEIEKLKIETEKFLQKEKEKNERKQVLKLELEKKENDFYKNQIIKFQYNENLAGKEEIKNIYDENLIKNCLDKILGGPDFLKQIDDKILDAIKESKKNLKINERLNIYIMGITGVGKTCLKNSICTELYSTEAFGKRGTTKRKRYQCECHKFLSLTDNIGFELGGNYCLRNLVLDSQNYIMEKIKTNEEAIHCIWYCITGTRLQEEEYKVICDLRKIYRESNIPFIIIYTQAIEPDKIDKMKNFINEKLKYENNEEIGENPENVQYIPLLAKQTNITLGKQTIPIKPYNLSKLIENTFNAYEYSVDLVNKKSLIELIKEKVENEYKNKLQSCFAIIENNNITENQFDYINDSICKQLLNNNKINTHILELNIIKEKILSFISEKYKTFKEEKENKILIDIMTIQREFCINNSNEDINLGPFMKSENELKAEIGHRIDSKNLEEYKIFYFNKICKIFFNYFAHELKNKILESFWNELESDKIKTEIYNSSKISNNKINDGITKLINELKTKET